MDLICTLLDVYVLVVFGRIIFSWFPVAPGGVAEQIYSVLFRLTEPVLGPLRRTIPPVRLGTAALDLSPIILVIGLRILQVNIC